MHKIQVKPIKLNAKISPIHWLRLIELAINGRPNIIKYQFKLTQQQFKSAQKISTNRQHQQQQQRLNAKKIKLVQKCKHVV